MKDKDISIQIQEGLAKDAKNYNNELYKMVKPYLGKNILEIGCSIGNITKLMLNKNNKIIGTDIVPDSIKIINKRFKGKNFNGLVIDGSDNKMLKLKKYNFDTIVCMNVLEHIEEDKKTLNIFNDLLQKKGNLILMVPAFQSLYGTVDKSDHHFRRYSKKEIKEKVEQAGFKVTVLRYSNFPGIFGWFLNGKILKKKMVDSSMLGFYDSFVPFIFTMENIINPPAGLSVLCVCEK